VSHSFRLRIRLGKCWHAAIAIASSVAVLFWGAPAAAQGMAVPGKFGVNATGAATYAIPIVVPPGTAGMLPSLSLTYSSQGGNGLLGMGFMLDGLPSIGRCPRTMAQDGVRGAVNYDANDRFCLDGQRLIATSGTYGANGTEYRTEVESFSKITSFGTAGNGPAWFEVKTKSGQIMQFGNTTDSRILAQGKTTARDWALNKVSDTKGNYFTVTYTNDTTNGQAYPTRIDYTGNASAGLAAYNSVRFVYDSTRPDVVPAYHAGSLRKTTVRLANVQTYAGANMVADYRLAYAQGSATGRSQLTSVTLCDGAGAACLPATTFAWQSGGTAFTVTSNAGGQNGTLAGYRPYAGDFNGDGLTDILWDAENATMTMSTGTRVLWTANGSGGFSVTSNFAGQNGQLSDYYPVIGDFNRDGKSDVWWYQMYYGTGASGPTTRWSSTPTGSYTVTPGPSATFQANAFLMDVNADGRADLAWYIGNSLTVWQSNADGSVTTTGYSGCSAFPGWSPCNLYEGGADFNGDGVSDILWVSSSTTETKRWSVWLLSTTAGPQIVTGTDATLNSYTPYLIDINGDGKTDILWDSIDSNGRSTGNRVLWISKGDGTFLTQTNVAGQNGTLAGYRPYISDFNGDGLPDILWVSESGGYRPTGGNFKGVSGLSGGTYVLWVGKGDGTFTVISNFGGQNGTLVNYAPLLGDFNGDGKTDVLWDQHGVADSRSTGTRALWLSNGVPADLMTSVTTGIGASIAITYKSLTDASVYTKDNTTLDPILDLQGAMYVVSRIDADNGVGGTTGSTYAYTGAKVDQEGRGFLGFRKMAVTDLQTNIVQTTTYRQDFPFTSLVANETRKLGAVTLGATTNIYGSTALGGTRYQVFLVQSQASGADLDGSVLPTATSAYQYDTYSNATQIAVSATDGFSKTTTNTYTNDATNWLLGRLTNASVTSSITSPGSPPAQAQTNVLITSSSQNLNLWNYLVSIGAASTGVPGSWKITIASGVTISSASASLPALDTGVFPTGSTLQLVNNGSIVGAGGNGGIAASQHWVVDYSYEGWGYWAPDPAVPAVAGGVALRAQFAVTVTNNANVWGGGGGGGSSSASGGGGAGLLPGLGGQVPAGYPASNGTATAGGGGGYLGYDPDYMTYYGNGGAGGAPGQPGGAGVGVNYAAGEPGGAAGPATNGNSFITWATTGDRRGPLN
jgi:hypothetical protein